MITSWRESLKGKDSMVKTDDEKKAIEKIILEKMHNLTHDKMKVRYTYNNIFVL